MNLTRYWEHFLPIRPKTMMIMQQMFLYRRFGRIKLSQLHFRFFGWYKRNHFRVFICKCKFVVNVDTLGRGISSRTLFTFVFCECIPAINEMEKYCPRERIFVTLLLIDVWTLSGRIGSKTGSIVAVRVPNRRLHPKQMSFIQVQIC